MCEHVRILASSIWHCHWITALPLATGHWKLGPGKPVPVVALHVRSYSRRHLGMSANFSSEVFSDKLHAASVDIATPSPGNRVRFRYNAN